MPDSSDEDLDDSDDIHTITCEADLDNLTRRLSEPFFLRSLSPTQLPSQATSEGEETPTRPTFLNIDQSVNAPSDLQQQPKHVRHLHQQLQHFKPITHCDADFTSQEEQLQHLQQDAGVNKQHIKAWYSLKMAADRGFVTFEQSHSDVVLAVDFNFYGNRMVTASADHRLRVWDRKTSEDNWTVTDVWKAHDAEIVDVKWSGPFLGEVLGSVAEDGLFKLWQEDVLESPNSGHRFRQVYHLPSETKVPYMSLDFKNVPTETHLALTTRDGYLAIWEPVDGQNLKEWHKLHGHYLCPTPPRQHETGFNVCFHHEESPSWAAARGVLDTKTISLAVAAMDVVKIFRSDKDRRFYVAAELTGARSIVRDVAWANGSIRGHDVIATASRDGCVRVYELHSEKPLPESEVKVSEEQELAIVEDPKLATRQILSGIGAGLAGSSGKEVYREPDAAPGRPKEVVTMVAEINLHRGAIWRVVFSQNGEVLLSTGDDGAVRSWKKALNGAWLEYAEIDVAGD